jgi:hypothetical protein
MRRLSSSSFEIATRTEGRAVLGSARALVDQAKIRVDHNMVSPAPSMAVRRRRRPLTYWSYCINYVHQLHFAMQQKCYRGATKGV